MRFNVRRNRQAHGSIRGSSASDACMTTSIGTIRRSAIRVSSTTPPNPPPLVQSFSSPVVPGSRTFPRDIRVGVAAGNLAAYRRRSSASAAGAPGRGVHKSPRGRRCAPARRISICPFESGRDRPRMPRTRTCQCLSTPTRPGSRRSLPSRGTKVCAANEYEEPWDHAGARIYVAARRARHLLDGPVVGRVP
jgi:hypothetical protein